MHRETKTAHTGTPSLARTTIEPYVDGVPGPRFYQRYAHAVGLDAERLLSELDGGRALLFPSGMAAVCSLAMATLQPGATVAVANGGYWGTVGLLREELSRWGLQVIAFDQTSPPPRADLVWLEPCSNPLLTFPDLDASIAAAHAAGARVAVDNTVLSPLLLRPLEHGADFVVHSATKILAGHHDALLGVVVCARDEDAERLLDWRSHTGIVAAPDPAWLLVRGLKTLGVRLPRQSATALDLARRLSAHPAVRAVRYPGLGPDPVAARYTDAFGPIVSFDVAGAAAADHVERSLALIENATSLGGTATTLEGRFRWEGDRVPEGLLRISAGLEHPDDLWADLEQALAGAG